MPRDEAVTLLQKRVDRVVYLVIPKHRLYVRKVFCVMSDARSTIVCRICGGRNLAQIVAREMMFGGREEFRYWECASCGCVQISDYPANIADHYPNNYYSFHDSSMPSPIDRNINAVAGVMSLAKRIIMQQSPMLRRRFLESNSTKKWLARRPTAKLYLDLVPDADKEILDIGCGNGGLLRSLDALYYRSIHGADPFIDADVYHNGKLLVRKAHMSGLDPYYDCISFHHVLEHMPNQLGALKAARALLAPDGLVIVRIPVVGGAAWRLYRENWVQFDPPRHYYLHSENSFKMLAEQAGFSVSSIEYDSTGFQFWGSELYLRGIPLMGTGRAEDAPERIFSADMRVEYDIRADELNLARDGDQIVAILRHNVA